MICHFRDEKDIHLAKQSISDDKLLIHCTVEMLEIAAYLRTLEYDHRPDYQFIYERMKNVMDKGKYKWSDPYDWEVKKNKSKRSKKVAADQSTNKDSVSLKIRKGKVEGPSFTVQDFAKNELGI